MKRDKLFYQAVMTHNCYVIGNLATSATGRRLAALIELSELKFQMANDIGIVEGLDAVIEKILRYYDVQKAIKSYVAS
ncbi:MAG: hypothetical protein KME47_09785 [Nodosilinea sp. WJT8-NPBG4]|jgi:hypothetical protein|nr:hypothetical protein [Nodosilinea sp. WJT8-NPBG4]